MRQSDRKVPRQETVPTLPRSRRPLRRRWRDDRFAVPVLQSDPRNQVRLGAHRLAEANVTRSARRARSAAMPLLRRQPERALALQAQSPIASWPDVSRRRR